MQSIHFLFNDNNILFLLILFFALFLFCITLVCRFLLCPLVFSLKVMRKYARLLTVVRRRCADLLGRLLLIVMHGSALLLTDNIH